MSATYGVARKLGFRSHRTFRLSVRLFALLLGLVGAYCFAVFLTLQMFYAALATYLLVALATILEFIVADVLADKSFPYDTERKLDMMANRLTSDTIETISRRLFETIETFRGCAACKISATVHVITDLMPTADHKYRRGLLQLTDYVGPKGGGKGRITTVSQGVVGRCARSEKIETVNFSDEEEYLDRMVCEFGFTQKEANHHSKDGRSYLAIPMKKKESIVGVVYFFTTEPQVFPVAASDCELEKLSSEFVNYLRHAELI